jgi:DNA invertase Pin-like site-specific DNA recombinase
MESAVLIGYARVSTRDQNLQLQLDALRAAGCEQIFEEQASGAQRDRPELDKMLTFARAGDTIVVWKLDRLARSLAHLVQLVDQLRERGVGFRCLTQQIDTTSASGRLVFGIFATLAEFEREMTAERSRAGLESARALGRFGGRRPKLTDAQIMELKGRLAEGQPWRRISREMSIAMSTISRYIKGLNDKSLERRRNEPARPSTNGRRKHATQAATVRTDATRG